jgi:hypothetical protein
LTASAIMVSGGAGAAARPKRRSPTSSA